MQQTALVFKAQDLWRFYGESNNYVFGRKAMIKPIVFATSILALMMAGYSNAGTWTVWSNVQTTYIHTAYGWYGFFAVSDTSINPDNCSADRDWYVASKQNNPNFNEIYSLMMAAHVSGRKVRFWVEGCSPHTLRFSKLKWESKSS